MSNKEQIENITLNRNWVWNGKEYLDIESWNAAIEAAANLNNALTSHQKNNIRKLKK